MQPSEPMPKKKESGSKHEPQKDTFTTIDDLREQAEQLVSGLRQLGAYKHPLAIRRGTSLKGEGVSDMVEESKTVKAGARTYFFDLKETKELDFVHLVDKRGGQDKLISSDQGEIKCLSCLQRL